MMQRPSNSPTDTGAALQRAASALQAGRATDAASLCRQVLKLAPGQPDALQMLATALASQGQAAAAEKCFLESLSHAPKRPDILVNFGNFLRLQGRHTDARSRLRKAAKLAPDFVPAWYQLGILLHSMGDNSEARRCAGKVTSLAPGDAAGWELLAAIEQKRGNPEAAIEACRKGIKLSQKAPRLYYSLGQLLRQECEFEEAASAYAAARISGHDTPELYINQAEALLESGDLDAAMTCADEGVKHFQEHPTLQRTRSRLHFEAGAAGDPVEPLRRAARQHPGNAALWCTLVQLLERLGRQQESDEMMAEGRRLGCPATPEVRVLEAMACAHHGHHDAASDSFRAILKDNPDHNDAKLTFAGHLLGHGDPAEAEALCAQALESDPHSQLAWCYRGTAWQLLGDPREQWLMDYERMVRPIPVPPPEGYTDTVAFMKDVQEALEQLHRTQAHPIEQSVRGGTQTNGFLFRLKHPLLRVLETQIRKAIATVLADFPEEPDHPFWGRRVKSPSRDGMRFSGAWSVRLRSEGYHTNHIHTEGWISSALYIALPDEVRDDPGTAGHIQFGVPMTELDLDLPPRRIIKPEVGSLALFPSYMWHGTIPFTSEQPRMTVAFDLQPEP
jgi:tetratricopeptide (TPR) repeat protein